MSTQDIQEEIERTRTEMASTLDAIEQKLSPRQLMDQAVDTMRDLASDQSRVGHAVRENPIPLALIGLGLAWFAFSATSKRRETTEIEGYEGYEGYEAGVPSSAWGSPGGLETSRSSDYGYGYAAASGTSGYGAEAEYVGPSTGGGGDGGQSIKGRASQMTGQASEGLSRATEQTRRRVSQWSRSARYQASHAADRTWETYQEHPITMGAVAVLLGAAIGAILPRSRTEEEMMGPQARDAMRQAREAAGDLAERAGHVAGTAFDKAKEEAKEALHDVSAATKEEAQRQGLTGGSSSGSSMTH
ncbi:MAG: DUF3618 domain-containing protein [Pseudomonadota bacterium]